VTADDDGASVMADDGRVPIGDIGVDAYKYYDDGRGGQYWGWAAEGLTDASGTYDVGELAVGTYRVSFYDWWGEFAPECYDDVPTWNVSDARCADISVGASMTASGVDASLGKLLQPANDDFSNAQTISGMAGTLLATNLGATSEPGEPGSGSSIWYRWVAPVDGFVVFDTLGSDFDTVLGVYQGTAVDELVELAYNDDYPQLDYLSRASLDATAGETYYVAVTGYEGDQGGVGLNWNRDVTPPLTRASSTRKYGKWTLSPATVTMSVVETGSGLATTRYSVDGGAPQVYAAPFVVTAPVGEACETAIGYASTDNAGNQEVTKTATVWVDRAPPSIPASLACSAAATSTVSLEWDASTDVGAGVVGYEVYKDGVKVSTVASVTTCTVSGLLPGVSATYSVCAIDGVGNVSARSVEMAARTLRMPGRAEVTATGASTVTVSVEGMGDVIVHLSDVLVPGTLFVTKNNQPPATPPDYGYVIDGPPEGYRFVGMYFDVDFRGEYTRDSSITITVPYDPRIPDHRAREAQIAEWMRGPWDVWDLFIPVVDTTAHTFTFTVKWLEPFALVESSGWSYNSNTGLSAGFGSHENTASTLVTRYKAKTVIVGLLHDWAETPLSDETVIVEEWSPDSAAWVYAGNAKAGESPGQYRFAVSPQWKTKYRMRFPGDPYNHGSSSRMRTIDPGVYVSTPKAPKTMRRSRYYTVYGYLKPKHASGTYPVRIWRYKKTSSGKWKSYGYVKAKASNYDGYTKYSKKLRLTSKGKWRLRAYAPADSMHVMTMSSGYDYVTVK